LRSILSLPFLVEDRVIGVLTLGDEAVGRFSDDDVRLLKPISTSAAIALENARLYTLSQQQRLAVQEANEKILDSLRYAQMIQQSLLANLDEVKKFLPDSFFLWKPRDIVGGDVFFVDVCDDGVLIVVIDCTGHGIPGAFMTMIAVSGLRRIVKNDACYDPAAILQQLNQIVKTTLQQDTEHSQSDDGLDAAICFLRPRDRTITFAGAKLPLYVVKDDEVQIIKGDRQSIGYKRSDLNFVFTNQTIDLKPGMRFYVSTDGFLDQKGGVKGFSLGKKRFSALLVEQSGYPFALQRENLWQAFEAYQGEHERLDDVTVVGFGMTEAIA
jgi:serine phosphatase RsbU (regulator of sigma subunit)